jgi:hypothetical protein
MKTDCSQRHASTDSQSVPAGRVSDEPEADEERWADAARLRSEYPDWVILWLAASREFRAYPLSRRHGAGALTAATAAELAQQISRAPPRRR